jgi:PAS domain S-box-containing protein
MRRPELWLYLLGAITFLVIALRRVILRQKPLNDELYAKQVAIEHVQSGVSWIRSDGTIGSVNPALAATVRAVPRELIGREWQTMFAPKDRGKIETAYRQALLQGKISLEAEIGRADGTASNANVLIVTVHDHKSRLIGHYCLVEDRSREHELEQQLRQSSPAVAAD